MLKIKGFRVLTRIHESQRTEVHRGVRLADDLPVILKVAQPEALSLAEITRFKQERHISRRLTGGRTVPSLDMMESQGVPVLVFPDYGSVSLRLFLQERRLDLAQRLSIAQAINQALDEIHQAHVIHGDLSPDNIIIHPETQAVHLIDFELASLLSREKPVLQNPNELEGTLAYLAPERSGRMNRSVDFRSDYYALGAILFELFTGRRPFESDDPLELIHRHLAIAPPRLEEIDPVLPPVLTPVVHKLMAKTAEARYQSAWGIGADLTKCLGRLHESGTIEPFAVGLEDFPTHFQIPEKLYGRGAEVAALLAAFQRAAEGGRELMLVAGYSGIGKSALVKEVYRPITRQRGRFISGKFDQFQTNVPYSAFAAAFGSLVEQLLAEAEESLDAHRRRLLKALGENIPFLTRLIPELEGVVGVQPAPPKLPPAEAQHRFNNAALDFVRLFSQPESPLALFLDDLQWVDGASLKLLEQLLLDDRLSHLFVIGAYRDNEVSPTHPLMAMLKRLPEGAETLVLSPLFQRHVEELLAETLRARPEQTLPLAKLIWDKTHGNPFFIGQFLNALHQKELIRFQGPDGGGKPRWIWEMERIKAENITDNVVDLLLEKLQTYPPAAQEALRLAASLGGQFGLKTLAAVRSAPEQTVHRELAPALHDGLLAPLTRLQAASDALGDGDLVYTRFRFLHDRVQQAAYNLIAPEQRPAVHLRIGRMLLKRTPADQRPARLFEIADHLNLGAERIAEPVQRRELAQLNLEAGLRAKAAAAHDASRAYLSAGLAALGAERDGPWNDLTLALNREAAEAAYLTGDFAAAERGVALIWEKSHSDLGRAEALGLLVTQHTMDGDNDAAIATADRALTLLGESMPADGELTTALEAELARFHQRLGGRPVEALIDLPEMTEPRIRTIMTLLMRVHTAAYFAKRLELYGWILARMTNHSLKYGNSPESSKGYASFGNELSSGQDAFQIGYDLGLLGLRLSEKHANASLTCKACVILIVFLVHWVRHLRESEPFVEQGYQAGMASGEHQFLGYVIHYGRSINAFHQGRPLEQLAEEQPPYLALTRKLKGALSSDCIQATRLALDNLLGRTASPETFTCEDPHGDDQAQFAPGEADGSRGDAPPGEALPPGENLLEETAFLAGCRARKSFMAECYFLTIKGFCLLVHGLPEAAYETILEASKLQGFLRGAFTYAELDLLRSLTLIDRMGRMEPAQRQALRAEVAANQARMVRWARSCPENFEHKWQLVEAELARLEGRDLEAMTFFEAAAEGADQEGFTHYHALILERAGQFWLGRGNVTIAEAYMRQAWGRYRLWGAHRKAEMLVQRWPGLRTELGVRDNISRSRVSGSMRSNRTLTSGGSGKENLDLLTVIKASQAISGEMKLEALGRKLLEIVLENAGAQRGFLILPDADRLRVEAAANTGNGAEAAPGEASAPQETGHNAAGCWLEERRDLCQSVVRYAARVHEHVLIDDATAPNRFDGDPYILRSQPRSLLCLPILHHGQLSAILYLENNLAPGAFTGNHLELLGILSSQVAISIQNARFHAQVTASESRFRSLFENAVEGLFRMDAEGLIDRCNPSMARLLGFPTPAALLEAEEERRMLMISPPPRARAFFQQLLTEGGLAGFETRILRPDGSGFWGLLSARSAPADEGEEARHRFDGSLTDVTERKRREEAERERAIAETRNAELEETLELREAVESITRHDLKAPLNAIIGFPSVLLLEDYIREEEKEFIRMIEAAGYQMLEMINRSLDMLKMETGNYQFHPQPVDLITILGRIRSETGPARQTKQIPLTVRIDGAEPDDASAFIIQGEELLCYSMFSNLIKNAVEAAPDDTVITLDLESGPPQRVSAHNSGAVPEEIRQTFFDKFSTSGKTKGTGLGTYSARLIAETLGGSITMKTSEAAGTTITMTFPPEGAPEGSAD